MPQISKLTLLRNFKRTVLLLSMRQKLQRLREQMMAAMLLFSRTVKKRNLDFWYGRLVLKHFLLLRDLIVKKTRNQEECLLIESCRSKAYRMCTLSETVQWLKDSLILQSLRLLINNQITWPMLFSTKTWLKVRKAMNSNTFTKDPWPKLAMEGPFSM